MENLPYSIDLAIRAKRKKQALQLIKKLRQNRGHLLEVRRQAAQFYRRLGLYLSAYRALGKHQTPEVKIEAALDVNLLGGSESALKSVQSLRATDFASTLNLGFIFLSNYQFTRSEEIFKSYQYPQGDYQLMNAAIAYLDSLIGNKKFKEAEELGNQLLSQVKGELLEGILHQIVASLLILQKRSRQSKAHLDLADKIISKQSHPIDYGYLMKWQGVYYIEMGELDQAKKHLIDAWKCLYRPGRKPEVWLEIIFWLGKIDFLREPSFPAHWGCLLAYPSTGHRIYRNRIEELIEIPRQWGICGQRMIALDEEPKAHLPDRLEGILAAYRHCGVPLFRICDWLWPPSAMGIDQNVLRVEQLIYRCRAQGIRIQRRDHHLWLKGQTKRFHPFSDPEIRPNFLSERLSFTRRDLEDFDKLSKSSAHRIIQNWIAQGWVKERGQRRLRSYEIIE